jgi:hypothetical protein
MNTYTIERVADRFDVHPETVQRWCRDEVLEYTLEDGERVIPHSEVKQIDELRSGLDSRTDRYSNLYLSVSLRQDRGTRAMTTGEPVRIGQIQEHGQCSEEFSRERTGEVDSTDEDASQYIKQYESAVRTVEQFVTGDTPEPRFLERLNAEIEALLMPLAMAENPPDNLLAIVEYFEKLLDGKRIDPTVVLRTTVVEPGTYRGPYGRSEPAVLQTEVTAISVTDSEAVSVPTDPPAASIIGDERWLEQWRSEIDSLAGDPDEGDTVALGLVPTPVENDRFEFRAMVDA